MLINKFSKKLTISVVTATLIFSSMSFVSAATVYKDSLNRTFVYNTNTTALNNSYTFRSYTKYLRGFNIRIINNNTTPVEQPKAPAPAPAPVEQPKAPTPAPAPVEQPKAPTPAPAPVEQPKAPTPAPDPVEQPKQNVSNSRHSLSANEIKLVEYVNKARSDAGLSPLAIDVDLSYVARVKSKDMSDNNYFSHTSPTYGSPFDMMKSFGIQYKSAAENIARTGSVEATHNGLMNSEGHRKNILNPRLTHIGIGIYNGYYTQMFIQK